MNPFEDRLRNALRRQPAPEGFAEKVLARAEALPRSRANAWEQCVHLLSRPLFRWAVAGVAVCVLAVAGLVHHQRQERLRREGELARAEVIQALRIASVKLNVARRKVQESGRETP